MKDELETSNIKEKFHQFGYKYTDQHRLILDVLLENPDLHLSSEDICEYFKKRKIDIGRSTVYRTLIVLEKMKIVRKVNLEMAEKEIVCIFGPSGCGKSTILNIISGLIDPSRDEIINNSRNTSYVFQEDRLLPWRDVYQNIRVVNKRSSHAYCIGID